MNADQLFSLVGWTNTDPVLMDAVRANGGSLETLSAKKVQELTTDFVRLVEQGVELSFVSQEYYSINYGDPRGAGPFVMSGAAYYPNGSSKVSAYQGAAPFSKEPVRTRDEAIEAFGPPEKTDEEDGQVYWDIWNKEGLMIKADYRDDLSVKAVAVYMARKS
ncbi:hypothetical protein [Roseateles depolymerans]|uniref:Uncharacterized protein n=1 Tax=Roseateles depolymerans TaxID=76731 RepID=A0A0U3N668_9BURK|nr:hypothetical protein [Roseateles depolymerans]ALV07691.1 hypothetical protein RD2015_3232 [Roseateles depolymerans]REG22086.1 hypothetical protein DES44_1229 [Roseateles depolymerans]